MAIQQKKIPAYIRISRELAQDISTGVLLENEQLPTERSMCNKYSVSRITVRHALALLEQQGLIRKRQGQGIFVCPRRYEQNIGGLYSFLNSFTAQGVAHRIRVLNIDQQTISGDIALRLGLIDRSLCYIITTISLVEDKPYAYSVSYVPQHLISGVTVEDIERDGIYAQIQKRAGLERDHAHERYEAVIAAPEILNAIGRRPPLAMMKLERVSSANSRPIELRISHLVGDKIGFHMVHA